MILWTREIQRRLTEEGEYYMQISKYQNTYRHISSIIERFTYLISTILRVFAQITFRNVRDGAGTPIIAVVSPGVRTEAEKYRRGYLMPIGKLSKPSNQAQNDELAREVWATTETLLKEWGI
ncbi:hypothetical protein ACEPAI_9205 [Sanghuangporus weigelae]